MHRLISAPLLHFILIPNQIPLLTNYNRTMNNFVRTLLFFSLIFLSPLATVSAQDDSSTGGIEIVSSLDQYQRTTAFNEDDYAGYILAYFKDQTQ